MILQDLGIKDLERVCIKTKNQTAFGNRVLEAGEPLVYFENLQIAVLSENIRPIIARGGWGNEPAVIWEDRQETIFAFSNGTVTTQSLNLLLNANMVEGVNPEPLFYVEDNLIIGRNGQVKLKYEPAAGTKLFCFVYDLENVQERVKPLLIEGRTLTFDQKYAGKVILCDYYFNYKKDMITYTMARERFTNLYTLEATFLMKDENDGLLHTGIIRMPKVRIVSNINMRLGERVDPMVSTFNVIALPESQGNRESVICEIRYLDEDITGI